MNRSIQGRLSLSLSIVILIAGLVAAATSFVLAYRDATASQDSQLGQVAAALSRGSYKDVPPAPAGGEPSVDLFIVVPVGGSAKRPGTDREIALPGDVGDGLRTIRDGEQAWRVQVTRDSNGERFGVVQNMEARNEDARESALFILIPLALLVPALLVAVHFILRTLFLPLARLSREIDRVEGVGHRAVPVEQVPVELLPFVQAVNRLLGRLGLALEQQARFVADAAHELRSPVAALMVQADNVQNSALPDEAAQRMALLRSGLGRMASLQDQLLSLARVRAPSAASPQVVAFDEIVRTTIEDLLPMANAKRIDLGCTRLEGVAILGDPRHAYSLVRNAIDNAIRYTPPGGSVDVSIGREGRVVAFVVEDTGPGIGSDDVGNVFEPFVRVLGNQETGSGLGLAIVQAAATAMHGTVELCRRRDGRSGLRFVYRQAAAPAMAVDDAAPSKKGSDIR